MIFTDEKSGVGFNPITIGGSSVEVRVYSTSNVFLGMMTTQADPSGTNFIGVWSPDPMERINIFDPSIGAEGGGAEGGDNIQAWEASTLIWFTDQAEFEAFMQDQGKVLKGIEDFEESTLDPNTADIFDDPLESDVPNLPDGFPFPEGLTGLPNLRVQSNIGGGNPPNEDPRGVNGLFALAAGTTNEFFVYLACFPAFMFWALDAYFLRQERLFRKLYDRVRGVENERVEFSMNTTPFEKNVAGTWSVAWSHTLRLFHGTITAMIIVVMLVIRFA